MQFARFLVAVLLVAPPLVANAAPKKHRRGDAAPPSKRLLEKASGPISLAIESVDLVDSKVVVLVGGVARAIDGRFFTFHDDRDRHFIALDSRCEAVADEKGDDEANPDAAKNARKKKRDDHDARTEPPKRIRCTLGFPAPYARAHVRALTVHIGQREVRAVDEDVTKRFADAQASAKPTPPKPIVRSPFMHMRFPDGGVPAPARDAGVIEPDNDDSEEEE